MAGAGSLAAGWVEGAPAADEEWGNRRRKPWRTRTDRPGVVVETDEVVGSAGIGAELGCGCWVAVG